MCVRHPGDQLLRDLQFRRVYKVVGGVDPKDRGGDGVELRLRVVFARRIEVIEEVVGVGTGDDGVDGAVYIILSLLRALGIPSASAAAQIRR